MQDALHLRALPPPRLNADIYETVDGDEYIVEIPVPGVDASDITIEATPDLLTVSTRPDTRDEQQQNGSGERRYLLHEQHPGPMSRVFEFPAQIDPDHISANLEAGMLKIRVPKAAATQRKVIKLQKQGS
jgi:HSP20 family protein